MIDIKDDLLLFAKVAEALLEKRAKQIKELEAKLAEAREAMATARNRADFICPEVGVMLELSLHKLGAPSPPPVDIPHGKDGEHTADELERKAHEPEPDWSSIEGDATA